MHAIMQEDARELGYPKWDRLQSPVKRVVRDNVFFWSTLPGDIGAHGRELALKFKLRHVDSLPAYDGFELLRVEVPHGLPDADGHDFTSFLSRDKIAGWLFQRGRVPGLPITSSSAIVDPVEFYIGGRFGCIKHPDGKIEPMGPSRYDTHGMCDVPVSLLVVDEAAWLASIKVEYLGYQERVRAFETGRDAAGNAVCQALFGGCPRCGHYRILNIRSSHWGLCDTHKTKWLIGSDIVPDWRDEPEADRRESGDHVYQTKFRIACKTVPDWRDETEAEWQENADLLAEFTEVESLAPGAPIPEPSPWPI